MTDKESAEERRRRRLNEMKWVMVKGIVRCEHCGFITRYGYQDKDTVCYNCHMGYFRFCVNEVRQLSIETKEVSHD